MLQNIYLTPITFRLPLLKGANWEPKLGRGGAKIKGSELGTEKRGKRKLKEVNWSQEKGI